MGKRLTDIKILMLLIAMPLIIFGMNPSFQVSLAYQQYSLSDLRDYHSSLTKLFHQEGIPTRQFYHFPSRLVPEFRYQFRQENKFRIALCYSFASTGSRIHYEDWSGEIRFDQIISNQFFGLSLEIAIIEKPILLLGYVEPSLLRSKMETIEKITTIMNSHSLSTTYRTYGFGLETGLVYELPFRIPLIRFHAGYLVTPPETLKSKSGSERAGLGFLWPKSLRADWSGWRFGVDIGFVLYQ